MKPSDRWSMLFPLVVFLIGTIISGLAYQTANDLIKASDWLIHTDVVIDGLHSMDSDISMTESYQRAYILTGNDDYWDKCLIKINDVYHDHDDLMFLTKDNRIQQRNLQELEPMLNRRVHLLKMGVLARRQHGLNAAIALVKLGRGGMMTTLIQNHVDACVDEEKRLMAIRSNRYKQESGKIKSFIAAEVYLLAFLVAPAIILGVNLRFSRDREEALAMSPNPVNSNPAEYTTVTTTSQANQTQANQTQANQTQAHPSVIEDAIRVGRSRSRR